MKELLSCLEGRKGLPPGWDAATALQRLSEHLKLVDAEIVRKLKGLEDLNSHLANLQAQAARPEDPKATYEIMNIS